MPPQPRQCAARYPRKRQWHPQRCRLDLLCHPGSQRPGRRSGARSKAIPRATCASRAKEGSYHFQREFSERHRCRLRRSSGQRIHAGIGTALAASPARRHRVEAASGHASPECTTGVLPAHANFTCHSWRAVSLRSETKEQAGRPPPPVATDKCTPSGTLPPSQATSSARSGVSTSSRENPVAPFGWPPSLRAGCRWGSSQAMNAHRQGSIQDRGHSVRDRASHEAGRARRRGAQPRSCPHHPHGWQWVPASTHFREITLRGTATRRLATTPRPWPSNLLADVRTASVGTLARTTADHAHAIRTLLNAAGVDLVVLVGADASPFSLLRFSLTWITICP